MIRKEPALGLDPGVEAGFPKRACPKEELDTMIRLNLIGSWSRDWLQGASDIGLGEIVADE